MIRTSMITGILGLALILTASPSPAQAQVVYGGFGMGPAWGMPAAPMVVSPPVVMAPPVVAYPGWGYPGYAPVVRPMVAPAYGYRPMAYPMYGPGFGMGFGYNRFGYGGWGRRW